MAAYVGLPWQRLSCGHDHLRLFLICLLQSWRLHQVEQRPCPRWSDTSEHQAEYALALDTLGEMGLADDGAVVEKVFDLFMALFAPAQVNLLTMRQGRTIALYSRPAVEAKKQQPVIARLARLRHPYQFSSQGFRLLLGHGDHRAVVEIDGLTFPERRDEYLSLALSLAAPLTVALQSVTRQRP